MREPYSNFNRKLKATGKKHHERSDFLARKPPGEDSSMPLSSSSSSPVSKNHNKERVDSLSPENKKKRASIDSLLKKTRI
jgi:hypothetical protein